MFNFSLSVCRHLMCRRSFRLMCNKFAQNNPNLESSTSEGDVFSSDSFSQAKPGVSFTAKYLKEMKNTDDIHWDWLTKKLEGLKMNNVETKILQACIRLDNLDLGLRYYDYLVKRGVKLSPIDLMFFSKLLAKNKSEVKKHEQLLIHLYNDVKEFLQSNLLIRKFLMEVFVEIPICFKDIVERGKHPTETGGYMPVVEKALELNIPEAVFEFMNSRDFSLNTKFIENYVNFCIRSAKEGNFSIDFINKLIDLGAKKVLPFTHDNLLQPLNALVSALNEHDSYRWSVHECELNEKQACSICGSTLLPNNITDEEFRKLKEHFFRQSFFESDVFLSSTREELRSFLKFLNTAKQYTLVLDGLNMFYKEVQCGAQTYNRILKHFLDKGHNVLTIGRMHSKENLTKGRFLKQKKYKSRAEFFFTSDSSDDDVFLLYAALYGGPGTFFLSGDFLNQYVGLLDEELKNIFLKWQNSHQYFSRFNTQLVPPVPHCGLSQLTVHTDEQYIWHLSKQIISRKNVSLIWPINWYCLKAEKKN